jgi:hypothetical protein
MIHGEKVVPARGSTELAEVRDRMRGYAALRGPALPIKAHLSRRVYCQIEASFPRKGIQANWHPALWIPGLSPE